jgi:hypothetical protein
MNTIINILKKFMEIFHKFYSWIGSFWSYRLGWKFISLDFGSQKTLIHIPFHFIWGFGFALGALFLFNNYLYAFYVGFIAGIVAELVTFFWLELYKGKGLNFSQNIFDIICYTLGALAINFMRLI